ncbi:MAG: hypothetical protein JWP65_1527 [Ramlibacter sp.]|uniref:S41 family peptidase n=1 Tax=Ramlibacter sp. TaxID=1917967 RepID=UPI002619DF51|nr:S41 family peptidase [Ramlibacter sp.]MDB5751106.1 hypothetical protein [Ramlibacter sp.]
MRQLLARPALAALAASALLLAACGGGGGGGEAGGGGATTSASFAGVCTLEGQKQFARAYLGETYLWYDEIREVDPALYANLPDYFDALLVRTPDANGLPKDRYSTVLPTGQGNRLGDVLKDHTDAVPVTRVVDSPGGRRAGYLQFNHHDAGAQDDLITAFRQLRDEAVQDLVLDLRLNSGGFLYVALAAASMVAGPAAEDKVFEQLRYNDQRADLTAASTLRFSSRLQFAETQYAGGSRLPQLDLPRVYVLASGQTCSSSESIVNGLRGIDVQVILVGDTTCGKPYGFSRRDNCGHAYFPIEFEGANAKGSSGYTAGFQPTCRVEDDPDTAAGSSRDPLLRAALAHADTGACPAASVRSAQRSASASLAATPARQPTRPAWAGRLLRDQR